MFSWVCHSISAKKCLFYGNSAREVRSRWAHRWLYLTQVDQAAYTLLQVQQGFQVFVMMPILWTAPQVDCGVDAVKTCKRRFLLEFLDLPKSHCCAFLHLNFYCRRTCAKCKSRWPRRRYCGRTCIFRSHVPHQVKLRKVITYIHDCRI